MLINPPFPMARERHHSDDGWVDAAMVQPEGRAPGTSAREGSFPLSASLMWHNGIHLQAPAEGHGHAAVRAVADGHVVFARAAVPENDDATHPQNYSPGVARWSDNGIVVIEHRAEVGAGNDAASRATTFVFYSLYMHLRALSVAEVGPGDKPLPVERKAALGRPGCIYGHEGQIHFEICCDRQNLEKIIGRTPGWKENDPVETPRADGRTDAVFGSTFVYLGAGTPTRTTKPATHIREQRGGASAASDLLAPDTLHAPLWVEIRYERGVATLTSYDMRGRRIGVPLENPESVLPDKQDSHHARHPQPDTEYTLAKQASHRHQSLGAAHQALSSPSAWFELLRFGRNLGHGAGADLLPEEAAHWRCIATAQGTVWADLNAPGSFKFSDADFLPIAGWNCFDDDPRPDNQLCESYALRRLLQDPDELRARTEKLPEREERQLLGRRLGDPANRRLLRRAICRFPSEWDQQSIELRHAWLQRPESGFGLDDPANWDRFTAHLRVMSFADLPECYLKADWRFHPAEFIAVFRRCGWLGEKELEKVYSATGLEIRERYRLALNRVARKYMISASPIRMSHFYGQGAVESMALTSMQETSQPSFVGADGVRRGRSTTESSKISESVLGHWYGFLSSEFDAAFSSEKYTRLGVRYGGSYSWILGNCGDLDAQKFRGRGFKQLTGRSNYTDYWIYRGWLKSPFTPVWWTDPAYSRRNANAMTKIPAVIDDPQLAATDPLSCIDTGGHYIIFDRPGIVPAIDTDMNIAETEDEISAERLIVNAVTLAINGGAAADQKRIIWTSTLKRFFL